MRIERARLLAERLHANDYDEDGTALLEHIRRVARRVDVDEQVVAWLHEVLEWTAVAEPELLRGGLDSEELRALRLLYRRVDVDEQVVAWLHEVLEWTAVAEPELLRGGLDIEELRALRLL